MHPDRSISGYMNVCVRVTCVLFVLCFACRSFADDTWIQISKSQQELLVKRGNVTVRSYHIAYGRGGNGSKRQFGDNKTPTGVYRIADFKPDSRFFMFMLLDYPNLSDAWHGYKDRLIDASQFRRISVAYRDHELPPQDTALGGYIGIHGIGDVTREKLHIHSFDNWTEGCIALTNEDIADLRKFVSVGTTVVINK